MKRRLIDAEEFLVRLSQYSRDDGYINLHMGTITTIVDNTPTVAEKPHGEWIREVIVEEPRKNKRAYARCSSCGCLYNHYGIAVKHFDFCPKCGADMREEGGEK